MGTFGFRLGMNPHAGWRMSVPLGLHIKKNRKKNIYLQLAKEIAAFLDGDEDIDKINFHIGLISRRIHITGGKIKEIGQRLQNNVLKIVIDDDGLENRGAGATFGSNVFTFRGKIMFTAEEIAKMPEAMARMVRDTLFRGDVWSRELVIHEAVHAVLEHENRNILRVNNEAAAYLAAALYRTYTSAYGKTELKENAIAREANKLIQKKKLDSIPGGKVSWLEGKALRKAILEHPEKLYNFPWFTRMR